jgi:serine protease Do
MIQSTPSGSNDPRRRKILGPRRLTLLASVAGLSVAVLLGGPAGHGSAILHDWTTAAHAAPAQGPVQTPAGFADIVAKVKPAVISVRVKIDEAGNAVGNDESEVAPGSPFYRFFQFPNVPNLQEHRIITGEGSGFIISADGYAVTNNHVVDHAKSVRVTTDDGSIYTAKVIGTDPKSDVALIKIDANKQFPFVKFADHEPKIGDWVVAVGNPFGLGGTVTAGIVSARGRAIGSSPYADYIQIDAPINRGNSGGPTFDMDGNVVGINTAIYSPSGGSVGIGFDIPATVAKNIVAQLKDKGHVTRGWMGVQVQPVTADIASGLGLKKAEGAIVDQPQAGSPAAKAGIKSGDVITAVNGNAIKDSRALARTIAMMAPGSKVDLTIWRNGEQKDVSLTLGTLPNDQQLARAETNSAGQDENATARLGLSVAPAGDVSGTGDTGVVVTDVDPNGTASDHGIKVGDVIVDAGGKPVSSPADLRNAVRDSRSRGQHAVLLRLKTDQGTRFVALPFGNTKQG